MNIKLKKSQKEYTRIILSKKYTEILYAGTAGTGKSFVTALILCMIINDYKNSRLGVFRKNLTTARKTIWHTYIKAITKLGLEHKAIGGSEPKIMLTQSGSVIEFFEMDKTKDRDFNKLKGLEISIGHIEEANEVDITGKNILITRIGRWNDNGVPAFITMTCNPSIGWVKEDYRDASIEKTIAKHRYFIESDASELEPEYRTILETLPEAEKERYLNNNWSYSNDPNQLISYEWIKNNLSEPNNEANHGGLDVAREGNDKTIVSLRQNESQTKLEELKETNLETVGDIIITKLDDYKIEANRFVIDKVGVGGGVIDHCWHRKYNVKEYSGGGAPADSSGLFLYKNMRAQSHWEFREKLRKGEIKMLNHPQLIKELTAIRYFIKDRYIQIESKEEIKKRLGFSPDHADATIMDFTDENSQGSVVRLDDMPKPVTMNYLKKDF